jgi:hypothetical protein
MITGGNDQGSWRGFQLCPGAVRLAAYRWAAAFAWYSPKSLHFFWRPQGEISRRGSSRLFLERLFTAPRNRPDLREDNSPYYLGVGIELFIWAVEFSRKMGHEGRIRLDSSPDAIVWYEKRGLKKLPLDHMLFEGVEYTPMELPFAAVKILLAATGSTRRAKK